MKLVRLAMELLGVAVYLAAHAALALVYALGSSLEGVPPVPYWSAIGAGYAGMVLVALIRPGTIRNVPRRRVFDTWLVAAVPAFILCAVFVIERWPLELRGWDGHGLSAQGGEANAALFPWLQGVLWVVGVIAVRRPAGSPEP